MTNCALCEIEHIICFSETCSLCDVAQPTNNCEVCQKRICPWHSEIKIIESVEGEVIGFYIFCKECFEKGDNAVKKEEK